MRGVVKLLVMIIMGDLRVAGEGERGRGGGGMVVDHWVQSVCGSRQLEQLMTGASPLTCWCPGSIPPPHSH